MPKTVPEFPKDFEKPKPRQDCRRSYEIELITPMVGGGAETGKIDQNHPIRPTALRGHLRYWWRLSMGLRLGAGMWRREEEIFGSTEFPSPLIVSVSQPSGVKQFDPAVDRRVERFGPIAYALFASIENGQMVTGEGLGFNLTLAWPTSEDLSKRRKAQNDQRRAKGQPLLPETVAPIDDEIQSALRAWVAFGGLGGRTRRGCGAIRSPGLTGGLPRLSARILVGAGALSPMKAWEKSLCLYQGFRQTPRGAWHRKTLGNGNTLSVPGRSHWAEADSIRRITGCSLRPPKGGPPSGAPIDEDPHDHSTPVVPIELLPSFPKAVLGLPINFHFADGPNKGRAASNRDPKDTQLYPLIPTDKGELAKADRMASPVITRPLWINGAWHPAFVILMQQLPEGFQVRLEGKLASLRGDLSHDVPMSRVVDESLGRLKPMRNKASAIDALLQYLDSECGFTEISR